MSMTISILHPHSTQLNSQFLFCILDTYDLSWLCMIKVRGHGV